jgi:hypothetical protein
LVATVAAAVMVMAVRGGHSTFQMRGQSRGAAACNFSRDHCL